MEFENVEFATQAKDYLNNKIFLGTKLKVFKIIGRKNN